MVAYVCSLKFSPGHISHMLAWEKLLRDAGYKVGFLLHCDYKDYLNGKNCNFVGKSEDLNRFKNFGDVIVIENPSTFNHILAKKASKLGTKVLYIYHEPWAGIVEYASYEGIKQAIKALGANIFSKKTIRHCSVIIVPSNFALELYKKHEYFLNPNVYMIPLLFDDEFGQQELDTSKKQYFSYIGHAVKGHMFDEFVKFINSFELEELEELDIKFQIATRTDITRYITPKIEEMRKKGFIKILHGKPLTNEEINQTYLESFCVWNVYNRSTQSGVLPKAFMFGTPVIARPIGSFPEFVTDGYNGVFINDLGKNNILEKALLIKDNLVSFSKNARNIFLVSFIIRTMLAI